MCMKIFTARLPSTKFLRKIFVVCNMGTVVKLVEVANILNGSLEDT